MKLSECRNNIEQLKGDIKETKKMNRKLQLRVETFEKKFELQQIKEQQIITMLDKAHEEVEQSKLEQETYSNLVNKKNCFQLNYFCNIKRLKQKKMK